MTTETETGWIVVHLFGPQNSLVMRSGPFCREMAEGVQDALEDKGLTTWLESEPVSSVSAKPNGSRVS